MDNLSAVLHMSCTAVGLFPGKIVDRALASSRVQEIEQGMEENTWDWTTWTLFITSSADDDKIEYLSSVQQAFLPSINDEKVSICGGSSMVRFCVFRSPVVVTDMEACQQTREFY